MAIKTQFTAVLSEDDLLDCALWVERRRLQGFSVNYRARIDGLWREVVRYDTCHQRLHVHQNWKPARDQMRNFGGSGIGESDYARDMQRAKDDLKENWQKYRRLMELHVRKVQ